MDSTFLQTQITNTQNQITTYQAAIDALGVGGMQSYMIDTGQTRQTVTKLDLSDLQKTLDSLFNRLAVLEARKNGTGTSIGLPAW